MSGGYQATNTGIPAAVRRAIQQAPTDPTQLLQSIDSSLRALAQEYVQPRVMVMDKRVLTSTATPATSISGFYNITDNVRMIVVQAIDGTIELVFGQDPSTSVLETFQLSDTNPNWVTLPWGNAPVQMWIRNPDATNTAQYGILFLGGNV